MNVILLIALTLRGDFLKLPILPKSSGIVGLHGYDLIITPAEVEASAPGLETQVVQSKHSLAFLSELELGQQREAASQVVFFPQSHQEVRRLF